MRIVLPAAFTGLISSAALAADLNLTVEIPRMNVAEYHRPYVAIWLERADQSVAANLGVWYEVTKKDGTTWLKDMRQWWRKSGRDLTMPIDGVSGATKPPGAHQVTFAGNKGELAKLPAGSYQLVVEAAREVGGREILRVPVQWPPQSTQSQKTQGQHELGAITLVAKP